MRKNPADWPFPTKNKVTKAPWPFPKRMPEPWPFPIGESPNGSDAAFNKTLAGYSPCVQETDPNGKSLNSMGAKGDAGKDRTWLCLCGFSNALAEVAKVTTFGANKYTPNGWVDVPNAPDRYMDAFARHMLKLGSNEIMDRDSGCKHIAQMIWNLLAVLELEERAANPNTGRS
jgi:hypothetical protein